MSIAPDYLMVALFIGWALLLVGALSYRQGEINAERAAERRADLEHQRDIEAYAQRQAADEALEDSEAAAWREYFKTKDEASLRKAEELSHKLHARGLTAKYWEY